MRERSPQGRALVEMGKLASPRSDASLANLISRLPSICAIRPSRKFFENQDLPGVVYGRSHVARSINARSMLARAMPAEVGISALMAGGDQRSLAQKVGTRWALAQFIAS